MSPRHILPSPPHASPRHPPGTPFPAALLCPLLHNSTLNRASWPCLAPQAVSVGTRCQQETGCPPGIGQAVGPVRARGLMPHGPVLASFISSLSLGASPEPGSGDEVGVQRGRAMGGRVAGAPTPLICLFLFLGPGHCSHWLAQGHPGHQTPGQGLEATSIYLSNSSCRLPLAPQPLPESWRPPQGTEWLAGPEGQLLQGLGDPPPWDTCNPGSPRSQGARLTSQEESWTGPPKPHPSTSKVRPKTGTGAGAACIRPAAGPSVQHSEAGRSEGLSGRPGWAAAPEEQARAGVAAALSCLITYTYSF